MNLRIALAPLAPIYQLGLTLRERRLASGRELIRRLRFSVISIGNLSTGGAGKTPLVIALARALAARGLAVDVLSRGYRRRSQAPARVDLQGSADEFGDEPLLIARHAGVPVFVALQRYDAGLLAEMNAEGALVHILDDGFQHRQLHRDVDILLLNERDWHDRLLPAGNLREALHAARRAHVIAVPSTEPDLESRLRAWGWEGPVWRLRRRMEVPPLDGPALAFCGIAKPDQFFAGLASAGVRLAASRAFPDHHRYTKGDLDQLAAMALRHKAPVLITTEKDSVRLVNLPPSLPIVAAGLQVEIEDADVAIAWLLDRIHDRRQLR